MNHLASNPPAPGAPSSERQASLDAAIQAKIRSEVSRLRAREAEIREQIERALEKENLDKESGADSGEGKVGGVSHSATLMRDLEELETRMVKITKKDTPAWHALGREREELVQCFRYVHPNPTRTPLLLLIGAAPTATTRRHRSTARRQRRRSKLQSPMLRRSVTDRFGHDLQLAD